MKAPGEASEPGAAHNQFNEPAKLAIDDDADEYIPLKSTRDYSVPPTPLSPARAGSVSFLDRKLYHLLRRFVEEHFVTRSTLNVRNYDARNFAGEKLKL